MTTLSNNESMQKAPLDGPATSKTHLEMIPIPADRASLILRVQAVFAIRNTDMSSSIMPSVIRLQTGN